MGADQDVLPGREGHVGGTAKDNRLFVEWRDLFRPLESGPSTFQPMNALRV